MIRMRVNQNEKSTCEECGCKWKDTREMYDILLCGEMTTICKGCLDELFQKILRMDVKYSSRVKSTIDQKRANNEHLRLYGEIPNRLNALRDVNE